MESDFTVAKVPLSFIEYRLNFAESLLSEWHQNGRIVKAVLQALRPWNVQLSGVSVKGSPANLGEVQISFEVIPQRVVFNLFLGAATLFGANLGWGDAPNLRQMIEVIRLALAESANADIASQQTTLAMHLTPQGKTVREITTRFAPFRDNESDDKSVNAFGFSIYRDDSSCSVDLSLMYGNSLFVRLVHNFDKSRPLEEIVSTLQNDQATILNRLQLRLE
jgi:hypothetical protein